jgi:hypothetical protein
MISTNWKSSCAAAAFGWLCLGSLRAVTVTTTFNDLSANNNFNNGIGNFYQAGDFNFASGGLFYYGTRNADYPGSGAIYPFSSTGSIITVSRASGQAFNFHAADFAARDLGTAKVVGLSGTRADGSIVSGSARLVGGVLVPQNFGFAGFTNLVSLQFTGNDQLDRLVFSDLVPPPASDATVHFDNATIASVGASYSENGYQLSSAAPGGMAIQSTMNDSHGLGGAGTAAIDLTHAGDLFNLQGFAIHSQLGELGQFRLIVTDESGADHTSSTFTLGTYDETALLQLFGGQAFHTNITSARFENTTGQGVVLDNIYAIPELSSFFIFALGIGARTLVRTSRRKNPHP